MQVRNTFAEALSRAERGGRRWVKSLRHGLAGRGGGAAPQVVFVAGVQRSGTNMMMDVLDRALDTEIFNEGDPRAFVDYELRPFADIEALVVGSRAPTVVFKPLCDLEKLRGLLDGFERAKAVWMVRHVDDMVNSHTHARFKAGRERLCGARMNAIAADPAAVGWRGRGMSAETLEAVRRHVDPEMSHESGVALFWYARNKLFFEQELHRDPRVKVVLYDRLVTDPRAYGLALLDWLDLPRSAYAVGHVSPRSIRRWPSPEVTPEIRTLCEDLQTRFETETDWLKPEG